MTMTPVPRGRELFKMEALDALARADTQYGEQQPELNALYLVLNALAYATLAVAEPDVVEAEAGTFADPDPFRPVVATIGEPEPVGPRKNVPVYTVEWLAGENASERILLFRDANGGVLKRWFLTGGELDPDGMIRDATSLAAWVAEGVLDDARRTQNWSEEMFAASREQAAAALTEEL